MKHTQKTNSLILAASRVSAAILFSLIAMATPAQEDALVVSNNGNVGLGISNPARQLHLSGSNAVVRLDRSLDAATFMMVRTSPDGQDVWKAYSVGTRSSALGQGEFVVQDFGSSTGGESVRRMSIANNGDVLFSGAVQSPAFVQTSAARKKQHIETLTAASDSLERLRGVQFVWKETGEPSLGLIAEEVAEVYPELVQFDDGVAEAVNYSALVAVLIEAFKEQRAKIEQQEQTLATQEARMLNLEDRLATLGELEARLDDMASSLISR